MSANGYRRFHDTAGLGPLVAELSSAPALESPAGASEAAAPILEHLGGVQLPEALRSEIEDAYRALCDRLAGQRLVASRSSAVCEDGAAASFAGIYETYLHLAGAGWVASSVLDCYHALWHPRAVQYRAARGVDQAAEEMAVGEADVGGEVAGTDAMADGDGPLEPIPNG